MPHRHRCFYCGRQAIAFDERGDGERTYLCEHHIPGGDDDLPSEKRASGEQFVPDGDKGKSLV